MLTEVEPARTREEGFFKRLWRRFQDFSTAIDASETSLLAERVDQIERRLRELDGKDKAKA
jgi:hypothetical protein